MSIANEKIVNLQDAKVLYDDLRGRIDDTNTYEKTISEANAIQSFDDGAAWPMGMQIAIDPVQDLHGYDYPWPAGGGKNLLGCNLTGTRMSKGITCVANEDGSYTLNGTMTEGNVFFNLNYVANTKQFAEGVEYKLLGITTDLNVRIQIVTNGVPTIITTNTTETHTPNTFTIPANTGTANWARVQIQSSGTVLNNAVIYPMVVAASETNYEFEPYENVCPITGWTGANVSVSPTQDAQDATVYPITFPSSAGTVYGGNLTVNADGTGTLVVDRASLTIPTIESYDGTVSGTTFNYIGITPQQNQKRTAEEIVTTSDVLQGISYEDRRTKTFSCYAMVVTKQIVVSVDGNYSVADFNSNIAGNKIVYILNETQSYTLSAPQVLSLLGQNHVWADTGNINELTYIRENVPEILRDDTKGQIALVKEEMDSVETSIAIVIDGDVAPKVITEGKYVYLKNHSTLPAGLYHATAYINSGDSISLSNVSADTDGGINVLQEKIGDVNGDVQSLGVDIANISLLYKIKKVLFGTGDVTMAANSYKKILNYSDIGTGIDNTHIVSVTGKSSNVNCPYWFEVYTDGIYIYVGKAITGKYVNVEVCYTEYAQDYRQITPSV